MKTENNLKQISKSRTTKRVYELLLTGGKFSVINISSILNIPDPRSNIRYLRNAGIQVSDYWEKSETSRYKIYFIR